MLSEIHGDFPSYAGLIGEFSPLSLAFTLTSPNLNVAVDIQVTLRILSSNMNYQRKRSILSPCLSFSQEGNPSTPTLTGLGARISRLII